MIYVVLSQKFRCKDALIIHFTAKCPHYQKQCLPIGLIFCFWNGHFLNSALAWFRKHYQMCRVADKNSLRYFKVFEINYGKRYGFLGLDKVCPMSAGRSWRGWDEQWKVERHHSHTPLEGRHCPPASSLLGTLQAQIQLSTKQVGCGVGITWPTGLSFLSIKIVHIWLFSSDILLIIKILLGGSISFKGRWLKNILKHCFILRQLFASPMNLHRKPVLGWMGPD